MLLRLEVRYLIIRNLTLVDQLPPLLLTVSYKSLSLSFC